TTKTQRHEGKESSERTICRMPRPGGVAGSCACGRTQLPGSRRQALGWSGGRAWGMIRSNPIMRSQRQVSPDMFFWMVVTLMPIFATIGGSLGAYLFNHPGHAIAAAVFVAGMIAFFIVRQIRRRRPKC